MYDIEHAINVSKLSVNIGKWLGLNAESLMRLYAAGLFHDIGKILVPAGLLEKPASLSRDEYGIIQWHTTLGHALLSQMPDEIHKVAAQSALCHHERMDGKGYPQGLRGGEIPLFSRIIAVADVYDALTTDRPYRKAWEADAALAHIQNNVGIMFDAEIVDALFQTIQRRYLMKRPLAYITAAWNGEYKQDCEQAARYCREVYEAGFSPVCPLLYLPLFLNAAVPEEHKSGVDISRDLLRRSHVLVVCGDGISEDVKNDIATAGRLSITATTLNGIMTVCGQGRAKQPEGAKGGSNGRKKPGSRASNGK